MLNIFSNAAKYIKVARKPVNIDNKAFKFHYRGTFALLIICTILVTSRQYIGDHIRCIVGNGNILIHVIETFCFFTSTFTIVRHLNETMVANKWIPHPGIGPMYHEDPVIHHAYYQWVPFVLFGQAIMFYLPHYMWKRWEGGKIRHLVTGMHMIALSKYVSKKDVEFGEYKILGKDTIDGKISNIKRAFYGHMKSNPHWGYKLIFCETLNLMNVVLQVYITDQFLSGRFLTLGIHFINEDFKGEMDFLDVIFPKMTKCHFYKYGPSGSIQQHDALCVMALNVINEKIYVVLWFWYILLFGVSVFALIWRFLTVCLHSRSQAFNHFVYSTIDRRTNPWDAVMVSYNFSLSDWLFLYYIAVNLEPFVFRNIMLQIANEMKTPSTYSGSEDDGIMDEKSELLGNGSKDSESKYPSLDTVDGAIKRVKFLDE